MGIDVDAQLAFGMPVCHSTEHEIRNLYPDLPEELLDYEGTSDVHIRMDGHAAVFMSYLVVRKSVIERSAGYQKTPLTEEEKNYVGKIGEHWLEIIKTACERFSIPFDPDKCGWYLLANCN